MPESPEPRIAERVLELRGLRVFEPLPAAARSELAASIEITTCEASERLAEAGKAATTITWVLAGRAAWTRAGEVIEAVDPGSPIGLVCTLAGVPAPCSAHATTSVRVARISADRFLELLEDSFDLSMSVLGALAADLHDGGRRSLGRGLVGAARALPEELDFTERLVRLRMSGPFTRAPIRPLTVLAQQTVAESWSRGDTLWERGEDVRTALVIAAGALDDGEVRLGPGDTAGLLGALAARPREERAIVREAITALAIDVDAVVDLLEDDDDLTLELLRIAADDLLSLRRAQARVGELAGVTASPR